MRHIFLSVLAATFVGASAFVVAQETTTEPAAEATATEETTTEETTTIEATTGDPVVGEETFPVADVNAEPKDGDQYIKEVHGDWEIRCIRGQEAETCRMYQLIKDKEGNSVAEMNLVYLPNGGKAAAGATFVTPLGTLLTADIGLRIDSGKARKYPYSWCTQVGCFARFGLTKAEIANMKKGAKATMTIVGVASPDKPINLDLSLSGFTAGWDAASTPAAE